jgi:predicted small lipoprotein YifL
LEHPVKSVPKTLLALALAAALAGCSRRQPASDADTRTVRVDKSTGDVTIIDGDTITRVKAPQEQAADDRQRDELAVPRDLAAVGLPALGGGTAALRISWRDDKVYYRFTIQRDSKQVEDARTKSGPSFEILLYSSDRSVVKRIGVPAQSMTRTKDEQDDRATALIREDSVPCSADEYRLIASWDLTWHGFSAR